MLTLSNEVLRDLGVFRNGFSLSQLDHLVQSSEWLPKWGHVRLQYLNLASKSSIFGCFQMMTFAQTLHFILVQKL